jgi:hypothetical protein
VKSRPAKVGDRLRTTNFGTGTTGFGALDGDQTVAVCVLPGTEIAFDDPVAITTTAFGFKQTQHKLARFRQTNKNQPHMHHDVLEFPDGEQVLLTCLQVNQLATVLQLPAAPKTEAEAKEQERVAFVEYAALKEQERAAQERAALFVEYAALREQERAAQESERHLSAKTQCPQDGG